MDTLLFRNEAVKVLQELFPEIRKDRIDSSVFAQGLSPGQWAPKALLEVTLEDGLPDEFYYPNSAKIWRKVEKRLSELYGKPVYFESINPAVTALWEV